MATAEESEVRKKQLQQIESFRRGTADSTPERPPASRYIDWFHSQTSFRRPTDLHHQIGTNAWDAAAGNHTHDLSDLITFKPDEQFAVEGGTDGTQPTFSGDPSAAFSAYYFQIGNLISFSYAVDFATITSFGSGQYYMTLPVPAAHSMIFSEGLLHDDSSGKFYPIWGVVDDDIDPAKDRIRLFFTGSNGQIDEFDDKNPITLDVADHFFISGTYIAQQD